MTIGSNTLIDAERLAEIKQSPRNCSVTDIEDLCDEVERLWKEARHYCEYIREIDEARSEALTELANVVQAHKRTLNKLSLREPPHCSTCACGFDWC